MKTVELIEDVFALVKEDYRTVVQNGNP